MKKIMPKMQQMQMQAQMQGDPRPMMVAQAEMQDEFFEATGIDEEDFQAAF